MRRTALILILTVSAPSAYSLSLLLDLISGAVSGVDWIATNTSRFAITSLNELNLRNGYVEVASKPYAFANAQSIDLSFDVYVPFNIASLIGAAPSPGEDLRIDYLADDGSWNELTTFVADNGFLGLLSLGGTFSYSSALPSDAYHDNFKIRYVMEGGGQNIFDLLGDNWYVSNILLDAEVTPAAPDHFRLSFTSSALTCNPHSITIQACEDAACTTTYSPAVDVTLSPTGWVGGDSFTLNGMATRSLSYTSIGTVALGVSGSTPAKVGGSNLCSIDGGGYSTNCNLTFSDAGLLVDAPDFLSAKGTSAATVTAVRASDNNAACVPAFSNVTKNVNFWTSYSTPSSGTMNASVGGTPISTNAGLPTTLALNFNAAGQATLSTLNYADAGEKILNAQYIGSGSDAGLSMAGSDSFIARPVGLCVNPGGICSAADANCGAYKKAGEVFNLVVSAVAWESDADADFCTGNTGTPNYSANAITLSSSVIAPAGGQNGAVTPSSYNHMVAAGGSNAIAINESEVGVFSFNATPPLYLGAALGSVSSTVPVVFSSAPSGRFTPDHYEAAVGVNGTLSNPGCAVGNLYSGETMTWGVAPSVTMSAHNAFHGITQNYTGSFITLDALDISSNMTVPTTDTSATGTDALLLPLAASPLTDFQPGTMSSSSGGVLNYLFSGSDVLTYARSVTAEIAPFSPTLDFVIDNSIVDSDGIPVQNSVTITPDGSGISLRFGRLNLEPTYGPETSGLLMAVKAEYFNGSGYSVNSNDSCFVWTSADATIDGISSIDTSSNTLIAGSSGSDGISLQAPVDVPGTPDTGDATVTYDAPVWLEGDYDGDGTFEDPTGTVTFGVYRGHHRLIFRREM
ncbi:MAG: DUF6701 domain-containing protein [Thalassolituus sp.]